MHMIKVNHEIKAEPSTHRECIQMEQLRQYDADQKKYENPLPFIAAELRAQLLFVSHIRVMPVSFQRMKVFFVVC